MAQKKEKTLLVKPVVHIGCLNVMHNELNCVVAKLPVEEFCEACVKMHCCEFCENALKTSFCTECGDALCEQCVRFQNKDESQEFPHCPTCADKKDAEAEHAKDLYWDNKIDEERERRIFGEEY